MNQVTKFDHAQIRQNAIDDGLLVDHSIIAEQVGFMTNVAVTPALIKGVISVVGKHPVEAYLSMFLQLCAAQTKVAFTDNKNWGKIRLYYPMPTVDGFFKPTEVVIKSDPVTADVTIMMASEEGTHLCL
ncbi:hypothetical protein GL272_19640 [Aeromonas veronii]|uniref:hypothetical protein n=1 Tax=Aeromonas TaxID=642 RepID=UPI000640A57E|nr:MULTISPECIES: hypothetical protein [Aeromonas]HDK8696480.1 hypothetical protein [Aeromonas hydrophila]AKJ36935.1 hypothetical protein U876_24195 [Aeromonas hydrophila NJ-35]MBW3762702.1 hypothetical protein [Aeromonas jandaei]MBW3779089.1 hypothetical protein [Aeromonas veronii]QGW99194.1 hypothetical protein FGM04_21935 [Aeromonas veronii]